VPDDGFNVPWCFTRRRRISRYAFVEVQRTGRVFECSAAVHVLARNRRKLRPHAPRGDAGTELVWSPPEATAGRRGGRTLLPSERATGFCPLEGLVKSKSGSGILCIASQGQARSGSMWVVRIAFFLMASLLADAFMPSASMPKLTPPCRVVASNREPRVAAWRMGSAPGDSETSRHVLVIAGGVENTAGRLLVEKFLRAGEKVSVISDNPGFTRGLSPSSARLFLGNPGRVAAAGGGQLLDTADDSTVVRFRDVVSRADTIVVAEHASNFPSPSWLLGASPRDMTAKCENIAAALERNTAGRVSKVVLLSSLGAARGLPKTPKLDANILFWVLNFWGALDAAGASEATLRQAAERSGAKFTIVRGKQHCYLKGPWGGLDEASFSEMGYAGVRVWAGDVGDGETSDGALAEALLHAAALPQADGRDITVVNARGTAPPQQASEWAALFAAL
jgi:hypothetical protein